MKKAALILLVLAPLVLAACGSSDDDSSSTPSTETTTEAGGGGGGEANGGGGGEANAGGGAGGVLQVEAVDGSGLEYAEKELTAEAGPVTIEFTNPQALSHDVAIEDSEGNKVGGTEIVADSKATASIKDLKPGDYTFFCTIPGHREAGMEGPLTVE